MDRVVILISPGRGWNVECPGSGTGTALCHELKWAGVTRLVPVLVPVRFANRSRSMHIGAESATELSY